MDSKLSMTAQTPAYLRQRIVLYSAAIVLLSSLLVALTTIWMLYQTAFQQAEERLVVTAQSQARLIESMARFETRHITNVHDHVPCTFFSDTLSQIRDAHRHYQGFGQTGEFTLAKREGDQIIFLLQHRHRDIKEGPISIAGTLAAPMRLALQGQSGTLVGLDYRGVMVLAAYEPVALMDLGIVAKIDLVELRAPFMRTGLTAMAIVLLIIVTGVVISIRITNPLLRRLEESEARYRVIVQDQTELICRYQPEGILTFVNQAYCRYFGKSEEELIGSSFMPLIPPEDHQLAMETIAGLSHRNPVCTVEHRVIMPSGDIRWQQWTDRALYDEHERLIEFQAVGRDITEQKEADASLQQAHQELEYRVQARTQELTAANENLQQEIRKRGRVEARLRHKERRLHRSEERYRQLFMNTPATGLLINPEDGSIVDANPMASQFYGYTLGELQALKISDIDTLPAEKLQQELLSAKLTLKNKFLVEHRLASGETRKVEVNSNPLQVQGKRLVYAIIQDTTEKQKAETALQKSEEQLRALFEHSPDVIVMVDRNSNILYINRPLVSLPLSSQVGRSVTELFPKNHHPRYQRALNKVLQQGETDQFEWAVEEASFWQMRLVPIRSQDRVPIAMLTLTDITEKRVLQAQAMKNARLATLGVLAGSVAHEVNNPNAAIQFSTSLLSSAWQDALPVLRGYWQNQRGFSLAGLPFAEMQETIPQLLTRITGNSQRINKIVENLKHLVRDDGGELDNEVNLTEVIEEAIAILHNKIQQHTDAFALELPDPLPTLKGNAQQLEQVLINILLNALQSLPERSKRVLLEAVINEDGQAMTIRITDEGCGISPPDLARVTEAFFTTKQELGGTGLGLSISQHIVQLHQGTLHLDSQPGQGTTVTVQLPLCAEPEEATHASIRHR